LLQELAMVLLVCIVFLGHFRSGLVAVIALPLGVLTAYAVMYQQGINANIMSLGGIAIAIGVMVDAAIVMVENLHKHLEESEPGVDRWSLVLESSREVGKPIFFSLLITTVSFLPVFTLEAQEGRLFAPLAFTKTYAMAAAAMPATAAEAVEEKTEFDVLVKEAGPKKIEVIKTIRQLTSLGLKEAKELAETPDGKVLEGVGKDAAEDAKKKLEEAGAVVELA